MITILFLILLMIMTFAKLMIQGIYLIHKLQQLGYKNMKYIKWLEGSQFRDALMWSIFELLTPLTIILILFFTIETIPIYKYLTSSIMLAVFLWKLIHPFLSGWVGPRAKAKTKKPLVYTPRVIRLFATLIIISAIIILFVFWFTATPIEEFTLDAWAFFKFNSFLLFVSIVTPIILLIANTTNQPIEKIVHWGYFTKAKRKLAKSSMVKIGITGSYGKTSTKFFLSAILSEKFVTLCPPSSYNTPMGISKIINSTDLKKYQYFVAEMGADHKGEIDLLCKLVNIDYGILTSIGLQHLETFGTIDNIVETKFAILENIPENNFGVYNYDSELIVDHLSQYKAQSKLYCYSIIEKSFEKVSIFAENIKHTRKGLEFDAYLWNGEVYNIKTALLGRHNASNLLAAILTAKLIGLSKEEICRGIDKITPVEHRLQLIDNNNGILVLDDAFNANLPGATEALRVLNEIEGGKKIVVTPGLIDLGDKEDEHNKIFGERIYKYCDIAILVGRMKTKKIQEGLSESGFNENNLYIVNSLEESKNILAKIIKIGDVVLFENDLPDAFSENN